MAVNRVGKKGPGPTSAASELGGKGLGNQRRMPREGKRNHDRQRAMHKLTAVSIDSSTPPLRRVVSFPLA